MRHEIEKQRGQATRECRKVHEAAFKVEAASAQKPDPAGAHVVRSKT